MEEDEEDSTIDDEDDRVYDRGSLYMREGLPNDFNRVLQD